MRAMMVAVAMTLLWGGVCHAERYYSRTVTRTTAQQDADEMARTGKFCHRGTCGCREGIGLGSTPEEALGRCCFNDGRHVVRERAVSRGRNGKWYAVIRYHD